MNPITHLLASWTFADNMGLGPRDRNLVVWCGVTPDLDGLGIVADLANRTLGLSAKGFYAIYHHSLLHGLAAGILLPAILILFSTQRLRTFLLGIAAVHLHLLCDLLGSRGAEPDDIWPVKYLAPFSDKLTLVCRWQWPINGWPNIALTVTLLLSVFILAGRRGHSPVNLFSKRADNIFVETIRGWGAGGKQ
jgi:hypothetical protein